MAGFTMPDWEQMFVPATSLAESFLRGSVVYLSILVLFRVVMKRQGGSIGLPDVMLVVLVSECVSTALSGEAKSVPNGLAAVSALLFWSYVLDRLAHRWPWLQRLLEPAPLQLVRDGARIRENMDAEGITDEELMAQLRENGIDAVEKVKAAFIEGEGTISVVPMEKDSTGADPSPADPPAGRREPPPNVEKATKQFLAAAAGLRAAVAWHEGRMADHRAAAETARELLARHGVRGEQAVLLPDPSPEPEPTR